MSKQTLKKHDESYCRLSANSNSLKFNHSCLIRNECTQIMGSSDHCSPACTLKFAGKVFKGISFQQPKSEKALKSFYTTDFSSFFLQPVTQKNELGTLVITCNSISPNALQYFTYRLHTSTNNDSCFFTAISLKCTHMCASY